MNTFAMFDVFLLAFPALADDPAAPGMHDIPPVSEFRDIVTGITADPVPRWGHPCFFRKRESEKFLATALMQAGFPSAAPSPVYMDPPLIHHPSRSSQA